MTDDATRDGPESGTQRWYPSAPDLDEVHRTRRWTSPDPSLGEGYAFSELRRGDLLPGTRLRIEGWLGEGTTAIVYRGNHVDLGRPLAIKVLKELDPDDAVRERFLAEARLTSELDSEYVVDVLDFGRLEDGRLYYAMTYLEGQPLDELLDEGPMPLDRALPLLRMACKGLQLAHDKGIVHRDIKPENMMVVNRRNTEQLVLVDFGIATSSGASGGRVCGTPYTMAPEQIEGRSVDARTDVYALGCCAFQMLTGRPFAQGTTLTATLAQHLADDRTEIDPSHGVPKPIAHVIHRCLALRPEDRFESACELEAALCEAQIAARIGGVGTHLSPPDVDEGRRSRISSALARPRRTLRVVQAGLAGMVSGVLLSLIGGWVVHTHEQHRDVLEAASTPESRELVRVAAAPAEPANGSDAVEPVAFSFAALADRTALDDGAPQPEPRSKRKARRRARQGAATRLAAMPVPPPPGNSLLGFRDDEVSPWGARIRARQLVRNANRAMRNGEEKRASQLYARAASLGSRRAHDRLEELGRG